MRADGFGSPIRWEMGLVFVTQWHQPHPNILTGYLEKTVRCQRLKPEVPQKVRPLIIVRQQIGILQSFQPGFLRKGGNLVDKPFKRLRIWRTRLSCELEPAKGAFNPPGNASHKTFHRKAPNGHQHTGFLAQETVAEQISRPGNFVGSRLSYDQVGHAVVVDGRARLPCRQ